MSERGIIMERFLDLAAAFLAMVTYSSAVAGAGAASAFSVYQPKTPKILLKQKS